MLGAASGPSRSPGSPVLVLLLLALAPARAVLPPGFVDDPLASVTGPTALAFTPDGRLLITQQGGRLRVYQNGSLVVTPALTFAAADICSNFERGLLGVAVDPGFASNRFIYLYYTFNRAHVSPCPQGQPTNADNPVNRVSRFTLPVTNVVDLASELVLIDNMPSPNGNHNAGDLKFGKDGYLYITIGDGGCDYANNSGCAGINDASRDQQTLTGKVLRIAPDGSIPASNPFQGAGTARCNVAGGASAGIKCQETFAWGLRNPFRIVMDPNAAGTRFFINDVGQNVWEEIDLGTAGADYGWNCREGAHTNSTTGACNPAPAGMVDPLFEYQHGVQISGTTAPTNCNAVTGGAFVPAGLWPGYDGVYLFSDYVCGWIVRLNGAGAAPPYSAADFATNLGGSSAVDLLFGPYGSSSALYYTTYAAGGQVRRISLNHLPIAAASASPLAGGVPLLVTFDGTGSADPDAGDPLTYFWTFGDGTPETSTASVTLQHTYNSAGAVSASLRVRDSRLTFSNPVSLQLQPGNHYPTPGISSPAPGTLFAVGQGFTLTGSASDPDEGSLTDAALSWNVLLHHNTHTHPYLSATGNGISLTAPAPEDLLATDSSYLEIQLTATDSGGLQSTVMRTLDPRRVSITVDTSPAGLLLDVNGFTLAGPATFTSWDNYTLNLSAPTSQPAAAGQIALFDSWSDAGAAAHSVATPASPPASPFTASYTVRPTDGALDLFDYFTVVPCRAVDTRQSAGPLGGPALQAGTPRTFNLTGLCGVPLAAQVLAINVTVVGASGAGELHAYSAGGSDGAASAVLAVPGSAARANNAAMLLGSAGGATAVFAAPAGTAHLLLDVVGYFRR